MAGAAGQTRALVLELDQVLLVVLEVQDQEVWLGEVAGRVDGALAPVGRSVLEETAGDRHDVDGQALAIRTEVGADDRVEGLDRRAPDGLRLGVEGLARRLVKRLERVGGVGERSIVGQGSTYWAGVGATGRDARREDSA